MAADRIPSWIVDGMEAGPSQAVAGVETAAIVLVTDRDGTPRIRTATDAAAQLYGYRPGELDGRPLVELAPPGAPAALAGIVAQRRKDGTYFVAELVPVEADGARRLDVREVKSAPLRRAEAELRDLEERNRHLFASIPLAALVIDVESQEILAANPVAHRQYGYEDGTLVGRHLGDIMAADVAAATAAAMRTAPPGPSSRGIKPHLRRDGTVFQAEVMAHSLTLDGRAARVAVVQDVTEREHLLRTLRESEQRYRLLFDIGPLPKWLYDIETLRIIAVNQVAVRHYGYSRDEFLAMKISDFRIPDDPGTSQVRAGGPAIHFHRRKDGVAIEVELSTHSLTLDGRTVMLVCALDISERRRLVEQLLQSQKMEAIGRLAGGVAHDFNNLLAVILVVSEWVGRELGERHRLYLDVEDIRTAALRAASLTRQLLAFSRQQVLKPKIFSLNSVVADLEKLLRRLIGEDVQLDVSLPDGAPVIRADLGQIEQVIMNLAVNARDAMPHGGRLRIATGQEVVSEASAAGLEVEPGSFALLTVSDDGIGMDAAVQARIFEPFFTTKEIGKGTGLGLSTVFGIVRQAGGAITVDSEPSRGATFRVLIPACAGDEMRAERPARPPPKVATETILLVEDDEQVRSAIRRILVQRGYQVVDARTGEAAVEAAVELADQKALIHLLVTDVIMPGVDGRMTAARLRILHPQLRVLYMSGYAEHPTLDDDLSREPGASFLAKPFSVDQLADAVRAALET